MPPPRLRPLAAALLLAACASAPRLRPADPPQTGGGELGQSEGPDAVHVLANGLAYVQTDAVADAYKAALLVVVENLLQSSPEERKAFKADGGKYFATAKSYCRDGRIVSQRTDEEGKFQVRIATVLNVGKLRADLEADGILKNVAETAEGAANPSVCVVPDRGLSGTPWESQALGDAQQYFTAQGYMVEDFAQNAKLNLLSAGTQALRGAQKDPILELAQQVGCDVYVLVSVTAGEGRSGSDRTFQATASVKILETTTGAVKGTGNGRTGDRVASNASVVITDAVKDAVRDAQRQLLSYWSAESRKGHQFRLTITGALSTNVSDALVDAIKAHSTTYKVIAETEQTLDVQVWSAKFTEARELLRALRQTLEQKGQGRLEGPSTRKMINAQYQP